MPSKDRTKPLLRPRNKIEELAMSPVARSILIGGKPDETILLRNVLKNINKKFSCAQPTVIWSGNSNGYHIYSAIQACILESESVCFIYTNSVNLFIAVFNSH